MAKRAQLIEQPKRARPKLDEAAMWPKGLNGWEVQPGNPQTLYRFYLVCYTKEGYVRERHGFTDMQDVYAFCNVHGVPA